MGAMAPFRIIDAGIRKTTGESGGRLVGLRFFYLDGLFASFSDNLVLGFLELFLLSYGVSNAVIGLNASIANLCGAVSIIPGAMAIARVRSRKRLVVFTAGGLGRLGLLAISCAPLIVGDSGTAVLCLISLNAIRGFMGNFAAPAWTSMVADLVPRDARARYFGQRNVAVIASSILAAPLAGRLVKTLSGTRGFPHLGFQAIFLLSFAVGMVSTWTFSRIPDASVGEDRATRPKGFPLRLLLSDRRFAGFALSAFFWNLALQVSAPFFNVYLVSGLGGNAAMVGLITAVASVTTMLGQFVFGRVTDRKGDIFVQVLTGLLIPLLPISWMLITRPRHAIIIQIFSGLLWAGFNLSSFNILLRLTPDDHRPEATALYQTLVISSAIFGPLIGGALADSYGFKAAFAVSGAGRFLATLLFIALVVRPGPLLKARKAAP